MEINTDTLEQDVARLLDFLAADGGTPPYQGILIGISKRIMKKCRSCIYREDIYNLESFALQYMALKQSGYSWINLTCAGILEENLMLIIELPTGITGVPFGYTRIEYHGPCLEFKSGFSLDPHAGEKVWDFSRFHSLIEQGSPAKDGFLSYEDLAGILEFLELEELPVVRYSSADPLRTCTLAKTEELKRILRDVYENGSLPDGCLEVFVPELVKTLCCDHEGRCWLR